MNPLLHLLTQTHSNHLDQESLLGDSIYFRLGGTKSGEAASRSSHESFDAGPGN